MDWRPRLEAPAARFVRLAGLALGGAAAVGALAFVIVTLTARAFVRGIELLTAGVVWVATSISVGVSAWTLLATIGRSAAGLLVTPAASAILAVVVLVGLLALYALQRLLGAGDAGDGE